MDERSLTGRAPWWFRKLVEAETANYALMRQTDPEYGRHPINRSFAVTAMYQGDELTLPEKLAKYGIVYEPGDELRAAEFARKRAAVAVPKLGRFIRDPDADVEREEDDIYNFGG